MDRSRLAELHYITAIENVPSILRLGLLSHRRANAIAHRSVAMQVIQERRARKQVPGGKALHNYVNLYVNGRNIMLSKVLYVDQIEDVCLLRINPGVLDLPGVIIADQNAASDYVRFMDAADGLARLDHATVFSSSWKHADDQIAEWRHQSAMCAEVLVPASVDPGHIVGAYVGCEPARQRLAQVAPALPVTVDRNRFFL